VNPILEDAIRTHCALEIAVCGNLFTKDILRLGQVGLNSVVQLWLLTQKFASRLSATTGLATLTSANRSILLLGCCLRIVHTAAERLVTGGTARVVGCCFRSVAAV